ACLCFPWVSTLGFLLCFVCLSDRPGGVCVTDRGRSVGQTGRGLSDRRGSRSVRQTGTFGGSGLSDRPALGPGDSRLRGAAGVALAPAVGARLEPLDVHLLGVELERVAVALVSSRVVIFNADHESETEELAERLQQGGARQARAVVEE